MRRSNLSKEEKERLLSTPLQLWPNPKPGEKYGPTEKQKQLFIADMPEAIKPHLHPKDITLFIGGSQSGKSLTAMVLAIKTCLEVPGVTIVYGAKVYRDLYDIVITKMKDMFTIRDPWDHPIIRSAPNEHNKVLEFINSSKILFMHLDEVLRLRGRTVDMLIIEECTQLSDSKSFEEASRRMSSIKLPILQIVLLTNNPENRNWVYEKFALKQFMPAYKQSGLPRIPIGQPCSCHLCQKCLFPSQDQLDLGIKSEEIEFINHICPKCKNKQEFYINQNKKMYCPGKQEYWRVIKISSQDNPHLPGSYVQDNLAAMDKETAALYIYGEFIELRKGYVYWAFTDENILPTHRKIDWHKNLIWSFDFNTSFQCSVICQEEKENEKDIVFVVDEVVIPETKPNGPQYIVAQFIYQLKQQSTPEEYENFKQNYKVEIYGDPNGYNRNLGSSEATYYQVIFNELKKEGFNLQIKVSRKVTGRKGKGPLPVITKVNNLNMMLRDKEGNKKVFVNPHCAYLIAGLDGVRFKPDGKTIDVLPDKNAAESTDKSIIFSLTHPTDALAYYISKRFPLIDESELINPFLLSPNEESIQLTDQGIVEKKFKQVEEKPPMPHISLSDFIGDQMFSNNEELDLFYW